MEATNQLSETNKLINLDVTEAAKRLADESVVYIVVLTTLICYCW